TPLALRCPSCATEHRAGQRFCEECGGALGEASPDAVSEVQPAVSDPELRLASVLFVDLVGFTSISESRDPEDVRELLSGSFEAPRAIIGRDGGVVEKFIGDAVMAVWGAARARENAAELGVRAALELVDMVEAFGEGIDLPDLRARGAVVTGQVVA